jgi:hypothetical protein
MNFFQLGEVHLAGFRKSSGSLAMFAAIRRASCFVSNSAAERLMPWSFDAAQKEALTNSPGPKTGVPFF